MSDRQTKQLVIAGRAGKAEWTRDDTARALAQGWGLFTAKDSKVMRVHRMDGGPLRGINLKTRLVFRNDEAARTWVKQQSTAGSDLHRRAWALDGKTTWQAQD